MVGLADGCNEEGKFEGLNVVINVGTVEDGTDETGARDGDFDRRIVGLVDGTAVDGVVVGAELRGALNTTLKPDSLGLFTGPISTLMLIVPVVTTTSTGKLWRTPYP